MQNKSEQSTNFEPMSDPSIFQCLQKLKQQNEYLKKALTTAQSLIKNYQQENNRLQIEIKILQCKLKKTNNTNQSLNSQTSIQNLRQSRVSSAKRSKAGDRQNTSSQKKAEAKDLQIEELNTQINKLIKIQERYEQKITEMQQKIVLLQRNRQDNKLNKQHIALTIGQTYFSTVVRDSEKKSKNLSELRALHLKLKTKEAEDDSSVEKEEKVKIGKGLVERVFSKQKIAFGNSSKKKIDHHNYHKIYEIKKKC